MVLATGGGVPAWPRLPIPRVAGRRPHACAMTTERSSRTMGGGRRRPDLSTAEPQRAPEGETGVMRRQRHINTIGCLTSEDIHVLLILAVSRTLPSTRLRTGVKGYDL